MLQQLRKTSVECVGYAFTFCSFLFQIACIGRKSAVCENVSTMRGRSSLAASGGRSRRKLKVGKDNGHEKFQSFVAQDGVGRDSGIRGDAAGVDAVVQGAGS